MTTASPNPRASLLSGLRTGGVVRSTSASIPHTAAPGGSFNVPRFASQLHNSSIFPEEDDDQMAEVPAQNVFNHSVHRMPMTAAVDGPDNRFTQQQQQPHQQQRGMNPNSAPFSPAFLSQPNPAQSQAFQMQLMQLELIRMQTMQQQQQQYQAQLLAQAQLQLQQQQLQQQSPRRVSFNPPATAGPLSTSFDLRSATLSAQMRRAAQNNTADEQVPMTAALGGKFGSRPTGLSGSRYASEDYDDASVPPTPNSTTVISGGTSLGSPASNNLNVNPSGTPSKSDSASTWRRGGNNNSVLSGMNRSPSVKVTPPPVERRVSPPPVGSPTPVGKARPQPLRFSVVASQPMPAVAIDTTEGDNDDGDSSSSSKSGSNSNPTTPHSSSSNETPLSPREEASKKLYEGLGIGRPASAVADPQQFAPRMASQPMRQPRGPPSGADELGPKNFATRIRRKAIGGLGMLMNSRERREFVEAY
ncbi:hypothetical protein C8R44DRAFT_836279 [Mycena epipterygia]|nr:hypothetical protein C8R44DRAFT_836279 [Mycena epipterygia]